MLLYSYCTHTRPVQYYYTNLCSSTQYSSFEPDHFHAVRRTVVFVPGTPYIGFWFVRCSLFIGMLVIYAVCFGLVSTHITVPCMKNRSNGKNMKKKCDIPGTYDYNIACPLNLAWITRNKNEPHRWFWVSMERAVDSWHCVFQAPFGTSTTIQTSYTVYQLCRFAQSSE
jgi:hypothetical protein